MGVSSDRGGATTSARPLALCLFLCLYSLRKRRVLINLSLSQSCSIPSSFIFPANTPLSSSSTRSTLNPKFNSCFFSFILFRSPFPIVRPAFLLPFCREILELTLSRNETLRRLFSRFSSSSSRSFSIPKNATLFRNSNTKLSSLPSVQLPIKESLSGMQNDVPSQTFLFSSPPFLISKTPTNPQQQT